YKNAQEDGYGMKNIRLKLARVEKELEKWSNNKQFSSCSAIFLKNKNLQNSLPKVRAYVTISKA
ncbi:TPA: hypothetical protein ACIRHS_001470, partial [Streptococcus suis]